MIYIYIPGCIFFSVASKVQARSKIWCPIKYGYNLDKMDKKIGKIKTYSKDQSQCSYYYLRGSVSYGHLNHSTSLMEVRWLMYSMYENSLEVRPTNQKLWTCECQSNVLILKLDSRHGNVIWRHRFCVWRMMLHNLVCALKAGRSLWSESPD